MNFLKRTTYTKLNKIIQGESVRNRAMVNCLKELGFPVKLIRKSVLDLNEIQIATLANGVSVPSLYNTLNGERKNQECMKILASSVGLGVDELFPE